MASVSLGVLVNVGYCFCVHRKWQVFLKCFVKCWVIAVVVECVTEAGLFVVVHIVCIVC